MESIITDDLEHCYVCGRPYPQMHHMMNKFHKAKSEQYGLMIPLCMNHHTGNEGVHRQTKRMLEMRQLAQRKFVEKYSLELWMKEFGKDYQP